MPAKTSAEVISGDILFQRELSRRYQREKQQGLGNPIISQVVSGQRMVAVGGTMYYSPRWKTFYDFLWEYVLRVLTVDWFKAEAQKPEPEQHPIFIWHMKTSAQMKSFQSGDHQVHTAEATGVIEAYYRLAYHLYLVNHNGGLPPSVLGRLKHKDQYRGAEHELYVAATLVKAGFTIEYENEADEKRTHCELTATNRKTGKKFSVEAKAKHSESRKVRSLLTDALAKEADHFLIAWLAIHSPAADIPTAMAALQETMMEIRAREGKVMIGDKVAPPAYVVVSNHPYAFALDSTNFASSAFAEGFQIPDLKFDQKFSSVREMRLCRDKHREIHDLIYSMRVHDRIPTTFDGEDPAFTFGDVPERLLIGNTYEIPDGDSTIRAQLVAASVIPAERAAYCFFHHEEKGNLMRPRQLSDLEMGAYTRRPETFFGTLDLNKKAQDPLDLYDWMYETYRITPKEKLLEFMSNSTRPEHLKALSQDELAVMYCEGVVNWTVGEQLKKKPPDAAGPTLGA